MCVCVGVCGRGNTGISQPPVCWRRYAERAHWPCVRRCDRDSCRVDPQAKQRTTGTAARTPGVNHRRFGWFLSQCMGAFAGGRWQIFGAVCSFEGTPWCAHIRRARPSGVPPRHHREARSRAQRTASPVRGRLLLIVVVVVWRAAVVVCVRLVCVRCCGCAWSVVSVARASRARVVKTGTACSRLIRRGRPHLPAREDVPPFGHPSSAAATAVRVVCIAERSRVVP